MKGSGYRMGLGGEGKGVNIGGGSQEGSEYRIGAGVTRSGSRWVKKE